MRPTVDCKSQIFLLWTTSQENDCNEHLMTMEEVCGKRQKKTFTPGDGRWDQRPFNQLDLSDKSFES